MDLLAWENSQKSYMYHGCMEDNVLTQLSYIELLVTTRYDQMSEMQISPVRLDSSDGIFAP